MAELISAILCDFVRQDGAVVHVIGGNIDTFYVGGVPTGANVGILLFVSMTRDEVDQPHEARVVISHSDGVGIAEMRLEFSARWDATLPEDWPIHSPVSMNFGLPLPVLGNYTFAISLDGEEQTQVRARVVQQQ